MINKISFTNPQMETLELELKYPEKSGYSVISIRGLTPVKADFNIDEQTGSDVSNVDSSTLSPRNIVVNLRYFPLTSANDQRHYVAQDQRNGVDVEELRLTTYKYFQVKKPIRILIETDSRVAETYGYVESNESEVFAKEDDISISIICPDPRLYSLDKTITLFNGVEDDFEFPFSNESLSESVIEFGLIRNFTQKAIFYDGEGDIGIDIIMHATDAVNNIVIYNVNTKEALSLNSTLIAELVGSDIIAGDTINISTRSGKKDITLTRNGIATNILNCLGKRPVWFTLTKGWNVFAYYATFGLTELQFRIENNTSYEGV